MKLNPNIESSIVQNLSQWQEISRYLTAQGHEASACKKIETMAIASQYAMQQLNLYPQQIEQLLSLRHFELDQDLLAAIDAESPTAAQISARLRQYRHRKLVEIIYLDVVEQIPQESILLHLSDLADQLIETAVNICQRQLSAKHGEPIGEDEQPMELNIIAMGKLGGRELNFSSDIDLICCFAEDGDLGGYGQLSYQEYFSRLVRQFSKLLGEVTADGFVYRVDLRLRPWGDSGPVALSHAAMEHYYQLHGREWEQYAMVKARVLTGSTTDKTYLKSMLKPFVYRRYHDYRVFEGLAGLKDKIDLQARARGMRDNIKIGQGGIREIEFFVQAFQILKGGRNQQLQSTRILHCFDALEQQAIVPESNIQLLRQAYLFLRRLENRIQMFDDQQCHDLPSDESQQTRIAITLDFDDWQALLAKLDVHRHAVSRCFKDLFKRDAESTQPGAIDANFSDDADLAQRHDSIHASGVAEPEEVNQRLEKFFKSKSWSYMSARAKQRFSLLLPRVFELLPASGKQLQLFDRLLRLFSSIAGRSVYFELLVQNQALLEKLMNLFDSSEWIAEELSLYPMLLENLIQTGGQERFDRSAIQQRLQLMLDNVSGDTELELDSLRLFKREQTLIIASAELAGEISAVEVSRYLCELAEVVLDAVYRLSLTAIKQQYGQARCIDQGKSRVAELAVIGYGKLGGYEMHYQSDLDLIFLHNSCGDEQQSDGRKSIDNSMYFARLAQKIISMTSVLTASGKLYEIDARLRPEGNSGLLVSQVEAYLRYQLDKAWTWEHQAMVRARLVAGSLALKPDFDDIREQVLKLKRNDVDLRKDIADMRERIYLNKKPAEGDLVDLKHARGGMVDIEFLVQYWVLSRANSIGSGCLYSDNISLLNELFRLNLITSSQSQLGDIYKTYHRLLHQSVLQNQTAEIDSEIIAAETAQVLICWNESFGTREK